LEDREFPVFDKIFAVESGGAWAASNRPRNLQRLAVGIPAALQ